MCDAFLEFSSSQCILFSGFKTFTRVRPTEYRTLALRPVPLLRYHPVLYRHAVRAFHLRFHQLKQTKSSLATSRGLGEKATLGII